MASPSTRSTPPPTARGLNLRSSFCSSFTSSPNPPRPRAVRGSSHSSRRTQPARSNTRRSTPGTCLALDRGCKMQLRRDPDERWGDATAALNRVAGLSVETAALMLRSNLDSIRRGFLVSSDEAAEGLEEFVQAADAIEPGFMDSLLEEMAEEARAKWTENLSDGGPRQRATETLMERLRRHSDP